MEKIIICRLLKLSTNAVMINIHRGIFNFPRMIKFRCMYES